jgi:hypothetical protein
MRISRWILAGFAAIAAACSSATDAGTDSTVCVQTYEFGNYGCARFDVTVDQPPQLPSAYMIQLSIVPVRSNVVALGSGLLGGFGTATTTVTLMSQPGGSDTVSVWVKVQVLDNSTVVVDKPLPLYAADSSLIVARYAPVGSPKPINAVHLQADRADDRFKFESNSSFKYHPLARHALPRRY